MRRGQPLAEVDLSAHDSPLVLGWDPENPPARSWYDDDEDEDPEG